MENEGIGKYVTNDEGDCLGGRTEREKKAGGYHRFNELVGLEE
jgi:hypothetical protein